MRYATSRTQSNLTPIRPQAGTGDCLLRTDLNALVCASQCYRTVFITYTERNNVKTQLKIENAALGMTTVIDGPINDGTPAKRFFTYQLRVCAKRG